MESEVVYYLYTFEVKVNGHRHQFYFENKFDAEKARFICYKNFDYERITTRNYKVPVSMVERVMLRKPQLDKTPYISSYADFEKIWFGEPEKPEIQTEKGQE